MHENCQERKWLQSVYRNCESVGVSKLVIERFEKYYLSERKVNNDRAFATVKKP